MPSSSTLPTGDAHHDKVVVNGVHADALPGILLKLSDPVCQHASPVHSVLTDRKPHCTHCVFDATPSASGPHAIAAAAQFIEAPASGGALAAAGRTTQQHHDAGGPTGAAWRPEQLRGSHHTRRHGLLNLRLLRRHAASRRTSTVSPAIGGHAAAAWLIRQQGHDRGVRNAAKNSFDMNKMRAHSETDLEMAGAYCVAAPAGACQAAAADCGTWCCWAGWAAPYGAVAAGQAP